MNGGMSIGPGLGLNMSTRGAVVHEPETESLVARFTTPPTTARKGLINDLIRSLKLAGVWAKLDALYILAAADSQAARQNWVQNLYHCTAVAAPTFTVDRGYQGDGMASYLDTGFAAATAGGKYALNNASVFAWSRSNVRLSSSPIIGSALVGGSRVFLNPWNASNNFVAHSINGGGWFNEFTPAAADGLFTLSRSVSTQYAVYRNAVLLGTTVQGAASLTSSPMCLLSSGDVFGTRQIAVGGFGQSLTQQNVADLYAASNIYLTAIGAA
ncbi:hypothetical protein [Rhizobium sp.]